MNCPYCGKSLPDNSRFCSGCGKEITAEQKPSPQAVIYGNDGSAGATTVLSEIENPYIGNRNSQYSQQDFYDPAPAKYNQAIEPSYQQDYYKPAEQQYNGAPANQYDTNSVSYISPQEYQRNTAAKEAKPKKKKSIGKKLAVILPITLVLALLIGIGSFVLVRYNSPLLKVSRALAKVVTSGDAYSISASATNDGSTVKVSGDVKFDLKNKAVELTNGEYKTPNDKYYDAEGFIYCNEYKAAFRTSEKYNGVEHTHIFYNGLFMDLEDGELDYADGELDGIAFKRECEIGSIAFDLANGDKTKEEATNEIADLMKKWAYEDGVDFDFDESDYKLDIDEKIIKKTQRDLLWKLSDTKFLEENFGYSKSKKSGITTYSFDIDPMKAIPALYEILEPLLKEVYDAADKSELYGNYIDYMLDGYDVDDIYDEMMDELDDFLDESKFSLKLEFEMKGSNIKSISLNAKADGDTVRATVNFEKSDKFEAPNEKHFTQYCDEGAAMAEAAKKDSQCRHNLWDIKDFVDDYKYSSGELPTAEQIKAHFSKTGVPVCPWSGSPYEVYTDAYGSVHVRCTDEKCDNYEPPYEAPQPDYNYPDYNYPSYY